jgi:hypothetical protein
MKQLLYVCGCTVLCWALAAFSDSWSFTQSAELLGGGISPSQGRYLHTGQYKNRINAHTSIPQVGFEPMIPGFELAKTALPMWSAHLLSYALNLECNIKYDCQKYIKSTCVLTGYVVNNRRICDTPLCAEIIEGSECPPACCHIGLCTRAAFKVSSVPSLRKLEG